MTTFIDPGFVDTNVLVYALDADSPNHAPARALLEAARDGSLTLYVTSQILCKFYSIVTNARRVAKPRSAAEALSALADLLAFLHVLPVPAHAVNKWMGLLHRHPITGGDVFDVQIIASMESNASIPSTALTLSLFLSWRWSPHKGEPKRAPSLQFPCSNILRRALEVHNLSPAAKRRSCVLHERL